MLPTWRARMPVSPDDEGSSPPPSGAAEYQNRLLLAIESVDLAGVRDELSTIPDAALLKASLLCASKKMEHRLRTPLMAAAAGGNMSILGAILGAFNGLFTGTPAEKARDRKRAMQWQLQMVDVDDMTLLMHASSSGCSAVFRAVADEVQPSQYRMVILAKDARGMTFLHHVVNAKSDEAIATSTGVPPLSTEGNHEEEPIGEPSLSANEEQATLGQDSQFPNDQPGAPTASSSTSMLDPWVPAIQTALEFAKKCLWMPEYRNLLLARDAWNRCILEHAVVSGRKQVFEAVFDAIREDIHDDEVDVLLDAGSQPSYGTNALSTALASTGGRQVELVVAEKTKSLKNDVSLRAEDSTVASKIQSFIPGNLIVIFQLLLPEFKESSDDPLFLLVALCVMAPFWSWGATASAKRNPATKNTRASPAMFFWGVGTSNIGTSSFGWAETASAAALAVATIIIPALDSFFSGRGARRTVGAITIFFLNVWSWLRTVCPLCQNYSATPCLCSYDGVPPLTERLLPRFAFHQRARRDLDENGCEASSGHQRSRRISVGAQTSPVVFSAAHSPGPSAHDTQARSDEFSGPNETNENVADGEMPVNPLEEYPPSNQTRPRQTSVRSIWENDEKDDLPYP